jgi:oxygen-independent coproporphyrinogen-3 oxidase
MRHLYIHVPFCARRCSYCDFAIAVRRAVPADRFVDAVLTEYARRRAAEGWEEEPFETVYLGGGTPSHLASESVTRLLDAFPRADGAEVTLEANPDDVTRAGLRAWRAAGVNRISLGVQSFDDRVLRWMHRVHDAARAREAVLAVRDAGIPSLSVDIMFGLPDALDHDARRDVDVLLTFGPAHVSAYGLSLEPRTPFGRWVERGSARPAPDDDYVAEFLVIHEMLTAAGYEHYEVSNYALGGQRSRHNSAYWQAVDYAALGPSAHGLRRGVRRWNLREWVAYERAVREGRDPVEGSERLTEEQRRLERTYLGLRVREGLPAAEAAALAPEPLRAALQAGWLSQTDGAVRATPPGWLVLDALVPALTTFMVSG